MNASNTIRNKSEKERQDDCYNLNNNFHFFENKKEKNKKKNKLKLNEVFKENDKNKYLSYNKESTLTEKIAINNFLKLQKPYLLNYSLILKEYQKTTKINNFVYKFCYSSASDSHLKLRYRASEYKKLKNKDFEKIYQETKWPSVVMKTSINIYIIEFSDLEKNRYPPRIISKFFLFDDENHILLEESFHKIIVNKVKENLSFYNNFSSGECLKDIKLKNRIIPKGTTFIIEDIEIFALRNKEKEKELKNYRPLHSHLRHLIFF